MRNFNKKYLKLIQALIYHLIQIRDEHKLTKIFIHQYNSIHEPTIKKEIFKLASPYLHPSFEGEAILTIGKAIDYINHGANGIVSVMPFTCMPGTIVSALISKISQDYNFPFLNLIYDATHNLQHHCGLKHLYIKQNLCYIKDNP